MEGCSWSLARLDRHYRVQLVFALEESVLKTRWDRFRIKVEINEA